MEKFAERKFNQYTKKIIKMMNNNSTTSSNELNYYGNKLFGSKFLGAFPFDISPQLKKNQSMIINVDESNKPGSHWCGVFCINKKKYLVFDSFGRSSKKLLPKFGKGDTIIDTDHDQNQKIKEQDCGQKSLSWLYVCYNDGVKYAKLI